MKFEGKSFFIITNGCPECRMEASEVENTLVKQYLMRRCDDFRESDLIVFLGCGVTQDKENLSGNINDLLLSSKRSDSDLMTLGCITKHRPELAYSGEAYEEIAARIKIDSRFGTAEPVGSEKKRF